MRNTVHPRPGSRLQTYPAQAVLTTTTTTTTSGGMSRYATIRLRERSSRETLGRQATLFSIWRPSSPSRPPGAARRRSPLCTAASTRRGGGIIAEAYAIARGLQKNRQAWRRFIEDDFWKKRKKKPSIEDRKAPLLHVMVFVFNAIDRNQIQTRLEIRRRAKAVLGRQCSRARGGGENQGGRRH